MSRPEVDAARIGATGRSGGGATSWWVSALDERVRASAGGQETSTVGPALLDVMKILDLP